MKKLYRLFTDHPTSLNESYFEHLVCAFSFATRMIIAGFACLIHSIFPFLFVNIGSSTIESLHVEMSDRSNNEPKTTVQESEPNHILQTD